jgi:hypothetical protein|nr:MAG TPA: hypothetical protein [Bacteriophage sp.]
MTTYSKKYFNEETQKWEPLYSTEGRSAYETAKLAGYTGSEEEFNIVLSRIPVIISSIENTPTEGSDNLITSGGVYSAIKKVEQSSEESNQEFLNKISEVNTNLTNEISQIRTVNIPNAIKESIIDNLDSTATDKALSANQGNILKTMIGNLANLRIEVVTKLPSTGEVNVIYLVKKVGKNPDVHDEYIYVENTWEKIGNTEVDLSNYYTKEQVYSKSEVYTKTEVDNIKNDIESNIPTIPNVETGMTGVGNVITSIEVDAINKHKVIATKGTSVYSKAEIDEKLFDSGFGDVIAEAPFTTSDRVITSSGAGKTIKDSGILLTNLATKEFVNQFEPEWNKIANKPSTFTPSAHTHTVNQITNFPTLGALASKDKVDESDLNFNIPEGVVIDSALSATSKNPVQNKVITNTLSSYVKTADLNVTLGNYYTTNEVYTKEEVDDKIASAGGGDVMASGDLSTDYIIVGAGTKSVKNSGQTLSNLALKSEIPSLSEYATQSWVTSQGYLTSVPAQSWSSITDKPTTLAGYGITDAINNFYVNDETGDNYLVSASNNNLNIVGGDNCISVGITGRDVGIYHNKEDGYLHVPATGTTNNGKVLMAGSTAGSIMWKSIDLPEIPTALPNPHALNITAGGSTTNYTGSSTSTINLDSIFSKSLASVNTPGKAGIFYGSSSSYSVSTVYVTRSNPDAVIVVPTITTVTFGSNYVKMKGLDDLSGGRYKCYCITYINTGLVLVNGAIYG